jgi:hypothetical protein
MSTKAKSDSSTFTGYCHKRGLNNSWTYKWFNYNPATGSIRFYVEKQGKKLLKESPNIKGGGISIMNSSQSDRPFSFQIVTPALAETSNEDATMTIAAGSKGQLIQWAKYFGTEKDVQEAEGTNSKSLKDAVIAASRSNSPITRVEPMSATSAPVISKTSSPDSTASVISATSQPASSSSSSSSSSASPSSSPSTKDEEGDTPLAKKLNRLQSRRSIIEDVTAKIDRSLTDTNDIKNNATITIPNSNSVDKGVRRKSLGGANFNAMLENTRFDKIVKDELDSSNQGLNAPLIPEVLQLPQNSQQPIPEAQQSMSRTSSLNIKRPLPNSPEALQLSQNSQQHFPEAQQSLSRTSPLNIKRPLPNSSVPITDNNFNAPPQPPPKVQQPSPEALQLSQKAQQPASFTAKLEQCLSNDSSSLEGEKIMSSTAEMRLFASASEIPEGGADDNEATAIDEGIDHINK